MDWTTKLKQMEGGSPGVPKAGSTGPVAFAPGMMTVFGRSGYGIPSARALAGMQNMLDRPRPMAGDRGRRAPGRPAGPAQPDRDVGVDAVTLQKIARALALDRYQGNG